MRLSPVLPLAATALFLLGGCGILPDAPETEYEGKSAEELYAMGINLRRGGDFPKAIEAFKHLEAAYPFEPYAQQGMLETAYSHYRQEEYAEGVAVLDRFIEQNPLHAHSGYAHYMRGAIYLDYGKTLLHYVLPYIRYNKDPTPWQLAFESFSQVVSGYPSSRYSQDARQQTVYLRNTLARYELHVIDFYLRRKAYVAVINRCRDALARYHGSPDMDEMLWYMEEAYRRLEMSQLADDIKRVRILNFPDYEAQRRAAEEQEQGWFATTSEQVSTLMDDTAILVGFDIEEFPAPDFSGQYRLVNLDIAKAAEYVSAHAPDKVVVSQVPSGYIPETDMDSLNLWDQFKRLANQVLGFEEDTSASRTQPKTEESAPASETPAPAAEPTSAPAEESPATG